MRARQGREGLVGPAPLSARELSPPSPLPPLSCPHMSYLIEMFIKNVQHSAIFSDKNRIIFYHFIEFVLRAGHAQQMMIHDPI